MGRRIIHERKEFDSLLDAYLAVYPWSDQRIDEWIEINDWTVVAVMHNGRSFLFDDMERRLREVIVIRDISDLTEEEWAKGFGQRLEDMIYRRQFIKQEFAEQAGISNVMLSKYINGRAIPRANVTHIMAAVLNCRVDELMPKDYILLSR